MANPASDLASSGLVNALYGEIAQANSAAAASQAFNITAAGDAAEAGQYAISSQLSTQNAGLELVSGQIQQFQTLRAMTKTIGAQRAGVAGAGFQDSGSAMSLARSSLQQGLLQSQVQGVNSDIAAGGYYAQAAASQAQGTAASAAGQAASVNAAAAAASQKLSVAQATATKGMITGTGGAGGGATDPYGRPLNALGQPIYAQNMVGYNPSSAGGSTPMAGGAGSIPSGLPAIPKAM